MNKIELLPKAIKLNDIYYKPSIYLTAWNKWCISYRNTADKHNYICSVTIEPENDTQPITDIDERILNSGIGNTKNLDDAVDMIMNYLKTKGYIK